MHRRHANGPAGAATPASPVSSGIPTDGTPSRYTKPQFCGKPEDGPTPIFVHPYRGDEWRLSLATYDGRRFADLRRWWRSPTGDWCPSRDGFTMPLERLPELHEALGAALAQIALHGPENGS